MNTKASSVVVRLLGKSITGADSGIGRAVAVHFAREGAKVAMLYLSDSKEGRDARKTEQEISKAGGEVLCFAGDVGETAFCKKIVDTVVGKWGRIDVLVNNAGEQHPQAKLEDITEEQWQRTFHSCSASRRRPTKSITKPATGPSGWMYRLQVWQSFANP